MTPRESLVQSFRYFVFDGKPDEEKIGRIWDDMLSVPKVKWNQASD